MKFETVGNPSSSSSAPDNQSLHSKPPGKQHLKTLDTSNISLFENNHSSDTMLNTANRNPNIVSDNLENTEQADVDRESETSRTPPKNIHYQNYR